MAMPANVMTVADLIELATSRGCRLVEEGQIAWRVNRTRARTLNPRYLVKGDSRVALPSDYNKMLNVYDVWQYEKRLGVELGSGLRD